MTEQNVSSKLTEKQLEQRKDLFCYTDLNHPVMQILFNLQLDDVQFPVPE